MVLTTVDLVDAILVDANSDLTLVILVGVVLFVLEVRFQDLRQLEEFAVAVAAFNRPVGQRY